ncbi:hypothetical protein FXB41_34615 [Bradyrhizobium canariense]|uniref:hypothetical protein n=1 Tax=Bradyrhizobium canariense TaxID=255045 RepID=UPI001CA59CB9|nr:hypothetical protein [Bradyrhizobium canariense]MBW5439704.1 hypothetical protein [Bradyrhizobium canariense]
MEFFDKSDPSAIDVADFVWVSIVDETDLVDAGVDEFGDESFYSHLNLPPSKPRPDGDDTSRAKMTGLFSTPTFEKRGGGCHYPGHYPEEFRGFTGSLGRLIRP